MAKNSPRHQGIFHTCTRHLPGRRWWPVPTPDARCGKPGAGRVGIGCRLDAAEVGSNTLNYMYGYVVIYRLD